MKSINGEIINSKVIPNGIVKENLLKLIKEYEFTEDSLSKIMRIDKNWINNYIQSNESILGLELENCCFLTDTTNLLISFCEVNNDERIKLILIFLHEKYGISYKTVSIYSQISELDINKFIKEPNSLSLEKKYNLGNVVMMLHFIFKDLNTKK